MLTLLLMLQAAAAGPPDPAGGRDDRCVAIMRLAPAAQAPAAARWEGEGGGLNARQCLGIAAATRGDWPAAAAVFEDVAATAAAARDHRAATYWAQAGNARLAAGDAPRAIAALDRALATPALEGFARGEAELDRGRAAVLAGDRAGARGPIDRALALVPDDPLAWLLSATLARQAGDLPRARADIAQTLRRAADDPAVQLEAGNIAAAGDDEAGAKAAWAEAVRLRPDSPQGRAAATALEQFR